MCWLGLATLTSPLAFNLELLGGSFQLSEWSLAVTCVQGAGAGEDYAQPCASLGARLFSASRAAEGGQARPRERKGGGLRHLEQGHHPHFAPRGQRKASAPPPSPAPPSTRTCANGRSKRKRKEICHHTGDLVSGPTYNSRSAWAQSPGLCCCHSLECQCPREHVSFLPRRGPGYGPLGAQRGGSILVSFREDKQAFLHSESPHLFFLFVFPFEETRSWGH